jgi:tRNA(Ile)-lysidine synthase
MARSHPPTLLKRVRRTLREECSVARGARILVAVSGGGDSAALLHALACVRDRMGLILFAHGVNHGLRQDAAVELELARRGAGRCQVPYSESSLALQSGGNLQARARAARYAALRSAAAQVGAAWIATGHHADDRAETVIMRLLRGAGPRGLGVLPARAGELLRPMIRARRTDVHAHLKRHAVPYAEDPSNRDRRYLRVRVRHELMPLLESLSPRVVEHLCALADQVDAPALPELFDFAGHPVPLRREHATQIQRALRLRLPGVRVRLPRGREIAVDPRTGEITLVEPPNVAAGRSSGRGAAKRHRDG